METKMSVREIMTREVITAEKDMKASEAGERMIKQKIGSLIVTEMGDPIGVVTERDLVLKIISKDMKPSSVTLKDIMTQPLITIEPDESVSEAARKMVRLNIRRLPVIENGKLVGIVTDTDMIAVSSELSYILSDIIEMNREHVSFQESKKLTQSICERCGGFSASLELVNGTLVCESCKDGGF
ncbi:MAG TPA: CBS domain-containing protein [Methanocellales archaeon]|nr:CBS domain-containing protein [Methanocellales archaeon]